MTLPKTQGQSAPSRRGRGSRPWATAGALADYCSRERRTKRGGMSGGRRNEVVVVDPPSWTCEGVTATAVAALGPRLPLLQRPGLCFLCAGPNFSRAHSAVPAAFSNAEPANQCTFSRSSVPCLVLGARSRRTHVRETPLCYTCVHREPWRPCRLHPYPHRPSRLCQYTAKVFTTCRGTRRTFRLLTK